MIKMILACHDEQYIEPFLHYVRFSEYQLQMSVTAFSQKEAFMQYMDELGTNTHVLLTEPEFVDELTELKNVVHIFYLVDELIQDELDREDEIQSIYKYQPLPKLLTSIIKSVPSSKTIQARGRKLKSTTTLLTTCSAQGGAGKTTVALNLCKQFSMQGIRAFYLNLENIYSSPSLEHVTHTTHDTKATTQGLGLSRLLYDLKRQEKELKIGKDQMQRQADKIPLSAYVERSEWIQADTFSPVQNRDEVLQMEVADVNAVIDFIMASGLYDIVIADVECGENARTITLLERCDQLIWLITEDWSGFQKAHYSWTVLNEAMKEKTLLVLNKHTGQAISDHLLDELRPNLKLPLIAGWNEKSQAKGVLNSPDFQRDILRLCQKVHKQESIA
jgi:cellulose biosynthesis protein BcsQ